MSQGGKVDVDFYVMSQCPYGTQVENSFKPVLDKFRDKINFDLNFIADEISDGNFKSMHGESEVKGNIIQLCAKKYHPDSFLDLVVCMNKNARAIPGNWETCAGDLKMDIETLKACYEGEEGKELLRQSIQETKKAGATASPTMYINGQPYRGARDTVSFMRAVCSFLDDKSGCEDLPACGSDSDCTEKPDKIGICKNPGTDDAECVYEDPLNFEVIVLNDETCKNCDTSRIVATDEAIFKGAKHRYVDISSEEGQRLVQDYGISLVPAYLFEKKVTESYEWKNNPRIAAAFEDLGEFMKLKDEVTKASHFVDKEKQKEFMEAIGLTPGDNKPQVDFFVMSYCPFGNQAEEALASVRELLKDKAEFKPHYVIYSNYRGGGPDYCLDSEGKYCSMHGVVELRQDIRELCVERLFGIDKWFDFALAMNKKCNAQNADECWEGVASELGIDTKEVKRCFDEEGLKLAEEQLRLNKLLRVSGSPTVFVEGQEYSGARTPEGYKQALCNEFSQKPEECGESLGETSTQPAPAPSAGGCGV